MNTDSDVMRYFPRHYTRKESNAFIDDNIARIENDGWGAWAIETIDQEKFIGFVGFSLPAHWHPCAGSIDIGWRLASNHWGKGYATEAAQRALSVGFDSMGFDSLVSFTSECNFPSIKVMQKIGMHKDSVGFDHPRIDAISCLRRHVVYRLAKKQWQARYAGYG